MYFGVKRKKLSSDRKCFACGDVLVLKSRHVMRNLAVMALFNYFPELGRLSDCCKNLIYINQGINTICLCDPNVMLVATISLYPFFYLDLFCQKTRKIKQ